MMLPSNIGTSAGHFLIGKDQLQDQMVCNYWQASVLIVKDEVHLLETLLKFLRTGNKVRKFNYKANHYPRGKKSTL